MLHLAMINKTLVLLAMTATLGAAVPTTLDRATNAVKIIEEIKKNKQVNTYLKLGAPVYRFANKLELHRYIVKVANIYKLDAGLLRRIVIIESNNCLYRTNTATSDFGCMQINSATIRGYGWHKSVITNDLLNVHAAAIVLRDFKRQYAAKEPLTWACRYNVGNKTLPIACETYLNKLALVSL